MSNENEPIAEMDDFDLAWAIEDEPEGERLAALKAELARRQMDDAALDAAIEDERGGGGGVTAWRR